MAKVGEWHFTAVDGQRDRRGNFGDIELEGFAGLSYRGLELGFGSWARAVYADGPVLHEKTIVCWVRMAKSENTRPGGSVMSVAIDNPNGLHEPFDGLELHHIA